MITGEDRIRNFIPDFDLSMIDEVKFLHIEFNYRTESNHKYQDADMLIEFTYVYEQRKFVITLKLFGVKKLSLPEIGTNMFELGELQIVSVESRDLPGVKYCVEDTLDGMLCYCGDAEFLSIAEEDVSVFV